MLETLGLLRLRLHGCLKMADRARCDLQSKTRMMLGTATENRGTERDLTSWPARLSENDQRTHGDAFSNRHRMPVTDEKLLPIRLTNAQRHGWLLCVVHSSSSIRANGLGWTKHSVLWWSDGGIANRGIRMNHVTASWGGRVPVISIVFFFYAWIEFLEFVENLGAQRCRLWPPLSRSFWSGTESFSKAPWTGQSSRSSFSATPSSTDRPPVVDGEVWHGFFEVGHITWLEGGHLTFVGLVRAVVHCTAQG
jgi:hypothetical protein